MKCLINGKIIMNDKIIEGKNLIYDNKIVDITDDLVENIEIIDVEGRYISPGLIDIHIHGNLGYDTMNATKEAITTISKSISRHGVTSYLPTTMTMDQESINNALDTIKIYMNEETGGAKVLGAHLEGPFINANYQGAQDERYIINPTYDLINEYKDVIKVITYAPEKDLDFNFTKMIRKNTEIVLSIGHSEATFEEAAEAIDLGVQNITHTFNAMTGLNHRNPGVVGAAMMSDVYCEIIADTIHIDPNLFKFIVKNKGTDKIVLITDSIEAGSMENGEYELGGQKVIVKDNQARLSNGALAGSVLSLNKMINNFYQYTDLNISEAIKLASLNPAKSLGINNKGSLKIGNDADIAIFDEDLECYMTILEGKTIYKR